MRFSEWKTKVMTELIRIHASETDPQVRSALETLIVKLQYARTRDLTTILMYIHMIGKQRKELLNLLPTSEDIQEWFSEKENEY